MKYPDCRLWTGSYYASGYGQVWSRRLNRGTQAHRLIYEELIGQIPDGLQIDHMCRVRGCVNPYHLRIVTSRENIMEPRSTCVARMNGAKTQCLRGHALDAQNVYITPKGSRQCRTCKTQEKRDRRNSARGVRPSHDAARLSGATEAVTTGSCSVANKVTIPPGDGTVK